MSSYTSSFKDTLLKTKLGIESTFRYVSNITKKGDFTIPNNYSLMFEDNFKSYYSINWNSSDTWWGQPYHPNYLKQWYDPDQIVQTSKGIEFNAVKKMRYFSEIGRGIPSAVCQLKTKEDWLYGIFVVSAKLSKGTHLWPAIWLCGKEHWPPEIDAIEAYSRNTTDYDRYKTLQSNVHFVKDNSPAMIRSVNHCLPNDVTNEFIEYTIWWEKDFIKIYYNGYLVRHVTDKEVLNKINIAQSLIIGSGVESAFNTNNISPLAINKVTVYQK